MACNRENQFILLFFFGLFIHTSNISVLQIC